MLVRSGGMSWRCFASSGEWVGGIYAGAKSLHGPRLSVASLPELKKCRS